jgi:hypothetical protein
MDAIYQRQLARLNYVNPEDLLREIMPTVVAILQRPETVQHLSRREQNALLEKHQAGFLGLFTKRIAERVNVEVKVAFKEEADFDCVLRAIAPGMPISYKPVQLKQLPSHETNAGATLQDLIEGLKRTYPASTDLVVGVWINRNVNLLFEELDFTGLRIEQLWFFADAIWGELTLDGGFVSELVNGLRWWSALTGPDLRGGRARFRPLQPA